MVDVSAIKSDKIIVGFNPIEDVQEVSLVDFVGRSYDLVMVGFPSNSSNKMTHLGLSNGKYYKSMESISMGITQQIESVEIDGNTLTINYGKDWEVVMLLSVVFLIVFGAVGVFVLLA